MQLPVLPFAIAIVGLVAADPSLAAQEVPGPLPAGAGMDSVSATSAAETQRRETLASAIAEAYAGNPVLAARRYDQRSLDDEIGIAMAQARPTAQVELSGGYEILLPGAITQAGRPLSDRLNTPNIERNDLAGRLVIDQPLWTGGRVSTAVQAATRAALAGRETLRAVEGDLLLEVIAVYADVRRDQDVLAVRRANLDALQNTRNEVSARRDAGELTRTDIAQAQLQVRAAEVQMQAAEAQLQASRAAFAALVGRAPGLLAAPPDLPGLPANLDAALDQAEAHNPELGEAVAAERASRARIALARSEAAPQIVLRGTAAANGPVVPFDMRDQDFTFGGRATLAIPLSTGGRVRALVAQAQNRNTADELRIEGTRRQVVQSVIGAWNQWTVAEQNAAAQHAQLDAARVFLEGSLAEYRQGLRSTFDVLFAQNSLRDAETALLASQRDSYVARAAILRRIGLLEAQRLLADVPLHDPAAYQRTVRQRNAVPWGGLVRSLDRVAAPSERRPEAAAALLASPAPRSATAPPAQAPATITNLVARAPAAPAGRRK